MNIKLIAVIGAAVATAAAAGMYLYKSRKTNVSVEADGIYIDTKTSTDYLILGVGHQTVNGATRQFSYISTEDSKNIYRLHVRDLKDDTQILLIDDVSKFLNQIGVAGNFTTTVSNENRFPLDDAFIAVRK